MTVRLAVALMVASTAFAASPVSVSGRNTPPGVRLAPVPSWVTTVDLGTPPDVAPGDVPDGAHTLLVDQQTRVTGTGSERFFRTAERVLSSAGLDTVSQLRFDFEPSYEQLSVHFVRVIREGGQIDHLRRSEIRVIQQEPDLDERLYNGTLSAILFLDDVRVGDVVDYAFTIAGDNPVLGGRFADDFRLADDVPVVHRRQRLLWPDGRTLGMKAQGVGAEPIKRQLPGETEYVWDVRDVPAIEFEDDIPGWYDPVPRVQLSEFATWADVVAWALPLYSVHEPLAPDLAAMIATWQSSGKSPEELVVDVTRFVQDEVRYLGIELGPYSHLPTGPSVVFARRFGDCKDKALLLVTALNALGIEAYPALVNTDACHALDDWQPSPYAFDHVIVQVLLGGRTYWIDATMTLQRGALASYYDPPYDRALVVRPGVDSLTTIPPHYSASPTTRALSVYAVDRNTGAASLAVTTSYTGPDADAMRYELSQHSLSEIGRSFLNFYASLDPEIEASGLPGIEDDAWSNTIVITERYAIPQFWKNGSRRIIADRIEEQLDTPRISRRSMPLAVRFPVNVSHRIEIRLERAVDLDDETGTIDDGVTTFEYARTTEGGAIVVEYRLRTLRDFVDPAQVASHLGALEKIRRALEFELAEEPPNVAVATWVWLSVMACFVLVPLGIGLVRMRKRPDGDPLAEGRHAASREERHDTEPGWRPDTALAIPSAEVDRRLGSMRCTCGRVYGAESLSRDRQAVTFDGQRMTVVGIACAACGASRDLYYIPDGR